jgi:2-dehydro-3-deoxy-L-rhamnonate dehydrogenase (NAD+)
MFATIASIATIGGNRGATGNRGNHGTQPKLNSQRTEEQAVLNSYDLKGRRAVVTGGAQGFGRAIAERFVASGARVAIWDLDETETTKAAAEIGGERGAVSTQIVDVSQIDQVDAAARATADALGGIDILVANAGIAGPNHKTWEYPPDEWRRVIEIDLMSVFYCCRAIIPMMVAQNYGRIVTISSVAGKEGNANASAYSTAKAGVIALTKSLGKELATENIAVNCITPAAAKTRIFEQMSQSHLDWMLSKIPRGRFLHIDELASLATWLASEENSFSTGSVFDISGGRSTY